MANYRLLLGSFMLFSACLNASTFMPPNDLHLQDNINSLGNITEDEFNASLLQIEKLYKPIIKEKHKANLFIVKKWADSTVNAYAMQSGTTWQIHMFGGLARRPEVTEDGFILVACHEMGHHLGGFPNRGWAANDGQSDYFATLSCGKELWKDQHARNAKSGEIIPEYPKNLCDSSWRRAQERNLCYRLMLAGGSLAALLSKNTAKYNKPSKKVVTETDNRHPEGQCRLDTYVAGAICKKAFDKNVIPFTEELSSKYMCLESRKEPGFRPKCWFKAKI